MHSTRINNPTSDSVRLVAYIWYKRVITLYTECTNLEMILRSSQLDIGVALSPLGKRIYELNV